MPVIYDSLSQGKITLYVDGTVSYCIGYCMHPLWIHGIKKLFRLQEAGSLVVSIHVSSI